MIRIISLFLVFGIACVRASELIPPFKGAADNKVTQPHVTAELIPETTHIVPGQPFDIALHLHMDPGWHTYWVNPGDAGLATRISWTLPTGFIASTIQWPAPELHNMGPLVTYGYGGDVYLLTTINTPNAGFTGTVEITAQAGWLVCKEECIPGKAEFTLKFDSQPDKSWQPDRTKFFNLARSRIPPPNDIWTIESVYGQKAPAKGGAEIPALLMTIKNRENVKPLPVGHLYFFPEQPNALATHQDVFTPPDPKEPLSSFELDIPLVQNGDKPQQLGGVFVSDVPLSGSSKAIYVRAFNTFKITPGTDAPLSVPHAEAQPPIPASSSAATSSPAQPWLIGVLAAAFVGGLILNLMPCVLPVLSLKVFSLMRHAGENPRTAWVQGVAFTVGVVISFWVLAGLLLALRAAGNQFGWGFQMQSPGFVLALIFIFFLLGLNLFGVFELGTSLVGLDAKATSHIGGVTSSFLNGALATVAATPCTAPFMGSSLGFAAQQPPFVALLVFTFLALGMAAPYLLLTIFPGALRFVPKPGAWMEAFKQFMGFLLMATVIFLIYVFGALVGESQVPWLLVTLLLAGLAAWIYGRWGTPTRSVSVRAVAFILALGFLAYALNWGVTLARASPPDTATTANPGKPGDLDWQPWSPEAVDKELTQGRPVFVDFTAAWCLSCKVNERLALDTDSVKQAFAQKNIALFRADWTHSDPTISNTLRQFNRDGVPLYLLYSPEKKDSPQVLPEVLTPGIVLDALKSI